MASLNFGYFSGWCPYELGPYKKKRVYFLLLFFWLSVPSETKLVNFFFSRQIAISCDSEVGYKPNVLSTSSRLGGWDVYLITYHKPISPHYMRMSKRHLALRHPRHASHATPPVLPNKTCLLQQMVYTKERERLSAAKDGSAAVLSTKKERFPSLQRIHLRQTFPRPNVSRSNGSRRYECRRAGGRRVLRERLIILSLLQREMNWKPTIQRHTSSSSKLLCK